jgi:uncharacterized phosphatase
MICVIRHGQTDMNKEGRLQGRNGLPLNKEGFRQAEYLKYKLSQIPFDYVFSSPQERAIQTAEIAAGKKALIDPRLDVYDLGEADGLMKSEVEMDGILPDARIYKGLEETACFMERIFSFMTELKKEYGKNEKNILISGHRCTTGAMGSYFTEGARDENILKHSSNNGDFRLFSF